MDRIRQGENDRLGQLVMDEYLESQPFRPVDEESISFIPDDLRRIVVQILRKGSSPKGMAAKKLLYQFAERGDPYFVGSAVYDFLWKRVATELRKSLYPIVGDFFLTALEENLARIGPNNMSSRFAELMECYTLGGDHLRSLEGPLYCVDLFLLKSTQLVLGAGNGTHDGQSALPRDDDRHIFEYIEEKKLTAEEQIRHSLQLAKDALLDTQRVLSTLSKMKEGPEARYLEFMRATLGRLTSSWQQWNEMHDRSDIMKRTPEQYFKEGLNRAETVNSVVLAALLLEQVGEEYHDIMCREFLHHRFSNKPVDHPSRGCIFDAGEIYRDQGILEREHGALVLSERRFTRAISLFGQLQDRTSAAQTFIERARVYMSKRTEAWRAHADLRRAAQNIAAVQQKLPPSGPLPALTPQQVFQFLEQKGLTEEALIYKAYDSELQS